MWILAKSYGWGPGVINEIDLDDMDFWLTGIMWLNDK